jgi:hypothetical protein
VCLKILSTYFATTDSTGQLLPDFTGYYCLGDYGRGTGELILDERLHDPPPHFPPPNATLQRVVFEVVGTKQNFCVQDYLHHKHPRSRDQIILVG